MGEGDVGVKPTVRVPIGVARRWCASPRLRRRREGGQLMVVDMLAVMIERAKVDGQIDGVVNHLVDGGLSILQYADDTILFMDHDLEKARNLKLILSAFEQLSGLKINFHKSELFCFGEAQDEAHLYAELFGCGLG